MKRFLLACLLVSACATTTLSPLPPVTGSGQRLLGVLVGHMTGTWVSRPETPPITIRIVEFWKGQPNQHWMYVEWVKPGEGSRPIRQRIFRLFENKGRIVAQTFLPPGGGVAYAGEWKKAEPFQGLAPGDLRPLPGCDMEIEDKSQFVFGGGTLARACRADRSEGAERSEFQFTSSEAKNLEQPFAADGREIETPIYDLLRTSREAL